MIKGFYTAGSGILTSTRVLDTNANNLANAKTAGYKRETVITETFGERLISKIDGLGLSGQRDIGSISSGRTVGGVQVDYNNETLIFTNNALDLAIEGDGFFAVQMGGERLYTRNGEFIIDGDGFLINANGANLLGRNGAINTGGELFEVDERGRVLVLGRIIDEILIYNPEDKSTLAKDGNGLFVETGAGAEMAFDGAIRQGYIEASNVDLMKEMMEMMKSQRALQSCSQTLKMIDSTLEKAVQIGKM